MKVAVFSAETYDRQFLDAANTNHELVYFETRLEPKTASLAAGYPVVCAFVNDDLGNQTLKILTALGVRLIALRCTGYNNVDLETAHQLGLTVVRVVAYSPYSVAEHAVALIQFLNRKLFKAYTLSLIHI